MLLLPKFQPLSQRPLAHRRTVVELVAGVVVDFRHIRFALIDTGELLFVQELEQPAILHAHGPLGKGCSHERTDAKQLADGAAMLCEVSGAANTMIRRWESVFRDYPDILTDADNRSAVKRNIQKVKDYLQKLEEKI